MEVKMRNIEIKGYATVLPTKILDFKGQTRYRCNEGETQLSMAVEAANKALKSAGLGIEDIDCIVSTSAVQVQPIPSTSALIHEEIAKGTSIPALDINTTCTSFVTALDTISYLIHAGRYSNVLLVASEQGSLGLNPKQKESYELFSDGAAAVVISKTDDLTKGIIHSVQKTWSEGVHDTEIRGGLTNIHPSLYTEKTKEEYMFDMNGKKVLLLFARKFPTMIQEYFEESNMKIEDIDMFVPHQASRALDLIMSNVKIPKNKYINYISEYGNMVSVSIPFMLCKALDEGKIKKGDTIILMGTAAGLTANILTMKI